MKEKYPGMGVEVIRFDDKGTFMEKSGEENEGDGFPTELSGPSEGS